MGNIYLPRLDAAPSNYFPKLALEDIQRELYNREYKPLKFRQFIPIKSDVDPGAEATTYYQIEQVGNAAVMKSYTEPVPSVDVNTNPFTAPVVGIGAQYFYSIQELRADAMARQTGGWAGKSLDLAKAEAARWFIERQHDTIASIGLTTPSYNGLFSQPITGTGAVIQLDKSTSPISLTGDWEVAGTTALQILEDIRQMYIAIVNTTLENHQPNTLLMPIDRFSRIATLKLDTGSDTTLLEFIRRQFPSLTTIDAWAAGVGAGEGGSDRAVMYDAAPQVLEYIIPQEFEQLPPQEQGYGFLTPCHSRTAGLQVRYPKAICYADEI